ncbi:g protein-coupled receptor [Anaeramoeba flamelloides]|uniref:G protein-coupled receptor n=1 Tax=Anaeramoeba flamelloides TaxID=1746091 RepID=A0ABQ8Z9N4_9EUKA|nr:g protein-coupled receptor [Anaeramoeba flamelloides]
MNLTIFSIEFEHVGAFIGSGLGIVGSILCFWCSRFVSINIFPFKHYLTVLSWFNFWMSIVLLIPGYKWEHWCVIQPAFVTLVYVPPWGISSLMSFMYYFYYTRGWTVRRLTKRIAIPWSIVMFIYGVLSFVVYAIVAPGRVRDTNWCWINKEHTDLLYWLYVPTWVFLTICVLMGVLTANYSRKHPTVNLRTSRQLKTWFLFPFFALIVAFSPSARRIREIIKPGIYDLSWLTFLQGLIGGCLGFADFFLFYLLNKDIRKDIIFNLRNNTKKTVSTESKIKLIDEDSVDESPHENSDGSIQLSYGKKNNEESTSESDLLFI